MNAFPILRSLVAAACLAPALPAQAQSLDAEVMKRYGGAYSADCANPAAARLRVTAQALLVEQAGKRMTGRNVQAAHSYFGNSAPPDYQVALLSEAAGGAGLLFIVYRDKAGLYITLDGDPKVQAALGRALLRARHRHCDGVGQQPAAAAPATAALAVGETSAPGLLQDPGFKAAYHKALGPLVRQPWLARLDGPSPLNKPLRVEGAQYVLASACKNHDCADHNTVLLWSASRGVVYGKVYQRGKTTLIGAPPPGIARALERLWVSEWRRQ